eukprot:5209545-Prymnesium_polylepis.1
MSGEGAAMSGEGGVAPAAAPSGGEGATGQRRHRGKRAKGRDSGRQQQAAQRAAVTAATQSETTIDG